MEPLSIVFRFIITFLASIIFGLDRQRSHKPIGFGTFTFVSIGACALSITAILIEPSNPLPFLGAIITGVGFLGAGAMIKTGDKIFGATTAAGIWIFAAFGLVIGTGQYLIGLMIYIFVWSIVYIDKYLEKRGMGSYQRKLTVILNEVEKSKELEQILESCAKTRLIGVELDKNSEKLVISYYIEGSKDKINQIPKKLYEKKWFVSFKVE
jgi:putative Mg2+ transporter-C (MgtC) family protein